MAEYIEKVDLVKRLESRVKDYGRDCNSNAPIISGTYQAVLHMVENLPTADVVEVETIKSWLYEMALNNVGCHIEGDFSNACEEIISRLDGLRAYASERRCED